MDLTVRHQLPASGSGATPRSAADVGRPPILRRGHRLRHAHGRNERVPGCCRSIALYLVEMWATDVVIELLTRLRVLDFDPLGADLLAAEDRAPCRHGQIVPQALGVRAYDIGTRENWFASYP